MEDEAKISFLWDVLKRYDHYLATTNFKAGLILSFLGILVFGVVNQLLSTANPPLCLKVLAVWIVICSIIAICYLLKSVYPKTKSEISKCSFISFSSVAELNKENYFDGIKSLTTDELIRDLTEQVHEVAIIVNQKFICIKTATEVIQFSILIPFIVFSLTLAF